MNEAHVAAQASLRDRSCWSLSRCCLGWGGLVHSWCGSVIGPYPCPSLARLPGCPARARPWMQRGLCQCDPSWPDGSQPSLWASWKQVGLCRACPSKPGQPQRVESGAGRHLHPFPPEQGDKLPLRKLRLIICFCITPVGSAPGPAPAGSAGPLCLHHRWQSDAGLMSVAVSVLFITFEG